MHPIEKSIKLNFFLVCKILLVMAILLKNKILTSKKFLLKIIKSNFKKKSQYNKERISYYFESRRYLKLSLPQQQVHAKKESEL